LRVKKGTGIDLGKQAIWRGLEKEGEESGSSEDLDLR